MGEREKEKKKDVYFLTGSTTVPKITILPEWELPFSPYLTLTYIQG